MTTCPNCNHDISDLLKAVRDKEAQQNINNTVKWIQTMVAEGVPWHIIELAGNLSIMDNAMRYSKKPPQDN